LDCTTTRRTQVLTEEKLDDTVARLGACLGEHLGCLTQKMCFTTSLPLNATKFLYLHPYKTTDNIYWLYAGEMGPALVLFRDEPWFHLSGWLILRVTGTGLHKIPY
jgi:hypothetical protein